MGTSRLFSVVSGEWRQVERGHGTVGGQRDPHLLLSARSLPLCLLSVKPAIGSPDSYSSPARQELLLLILCDRGRN